jgi:hypothetical protein
MDELNTEKLKIDLNSDPELILNARLWEGRFKLNIGDDSYVFQMHEGKVERILDQPDMFTEYDFSISGPADGWDELLAPVPKPFYQDLFSAWLHHGFSIEGDLEEFFGFHMALRRMIQILRQPVAA